MKRLLIGLIAVVVLGVVSCSVLLPDEYIVNVPLRGMLFGKAPAPLSELEQRITLPAGFRIGYFARDLKDARFMRFTATGDLLVSSPREGTIFLLERDEDGDGAADGVRKLVTGLDFPHGLDFNGDWLYIGEMSAIRRVRYDAATRATSGELETVISGLPGGGNHWRKTIRFGPDGALYVSVGSSCNVCIEEDPRRAAMLRYAPDGSGEMLFATGLRNSSGFDFHPSTGEIWATDNGRDLLGDDFPPCEFNRVVEGGFYGWPFANGDRVRDPDLGAGRDAEIAATIPPAHGFVAHTAPLGMTFYRGSTWPARYRGAAFVAQHGSWNRSTKSGYRVVVLEWQDDGSIAESDFAVGFERDEDVIGRPVDVAEGPDGALYVSDDFSGSIYRIAYESGS